MNRFHCTSQLVQGARAEVPLKYSNLSFDLSLDKYIAKNKTLVKT